MQQYSDSATRQTLSLRQTYALLLDSAGSRKPKLLAALALAALSAALFGTALAMLYPLLAALAAGTAVQPYAITSLSLLAASVLARLFAEHYDTRGHANQAVYEWRTALGAKLRRIALWSLSSQRSGEIGAVLVQSVNEAAAMAFTLLSTLVYGLIVPLAAAAAMAVFDWRFGLVLLLVLPLALPLYLWRRKAFRRGFSILAQASGRLKGEAVEFTQGLAVLKATGQTAAAQSRFAQTARDVAAIQRIGTQKGEKPNLIITLTVQFGLAAVSLTGIVLTAQGTPYLLTAAALIIVARAADVLNFFVQMSSLLEIFVIGAQKLQTVMNMPELPERNAAPLPQSYEVCFENVSFTYPSQTAPALRNITLRLPEKSLTALAGGSGSGKTTLTRMLLRYADPDNGIITIGGTDIRDLPQAQLMSLISVVFQDVYLFQASIADNIRMAKPQAGDAEVEAAARLAQCHEFISRLPQQYQTILSDGGSGLSGGEKQRIAIARAILKDAPILILDEPTAALDTRNELAVQQALDALVQRKTVLIIAHRLSTITAAQQIAVLEQGSVVECGTHAELLARKGRYAGFWQAQHEI